MRIVIVGGNGTIGRAVAKELGERHNIIIAGKTSGDILVDMMDMQSIQAMYKKLDRVDAVIVTAGKVEFKDMQEMQPADYEFGLQNKLMGQVNLVLAGLKHLTDLGSFTLTSGILSHDPNRYGSSASMVNAAVDGFVIGAAVEMPRGIRINAVSPTLLEDSINIYGEYFRGYPIVNNTILARAYSKSVEGVQTGKIYPAGY